MEKSYQQAKYKIRGSFDRSLDYMMSLMTKSEFIQADMYGNGEVISSFENEIATDLGFDSACFFPSGTMAQQIALRIWSDRIGIKKVAYHPLCHLEIHEQNGIGELHQIERILLGDKNRLFTMKDVMEIDDSVSTILVELPQREIGGQLPTLDELKELREYTKKHNIKLHLDGARLFETLPYYGVDIKEITSLFDSVYVSFYKGLGGIAGAMLLGDEPFITEAKIWKRRHGGDLISLFPYILSARTVYHERKDRMNLYYKSAVSLARLFNQLPNVVTVPEVPVTNMFHVHFTGNYDSLSKVLKHVMEEKEIGITPYLNEISKDKFVFECSVGENYLLIPDKEVQELFHELKIMLENLL